MVAKAAEACPIIRAARDAAVAAEAANHGRIPPVPGAPPPCFAACMTCAGLFNSGVHCTAWALLASESRGRQGMDFFAPLPAGHHGSLRTPSPEIYSEFSLLCTAISKHTPC